MRIRIGTTLNSLALFALLGAAPPPAQDPSDKAQEIAYDDGTSAGKRSTAGGGHAVAFDAPAGGAWALSAVKIYGSRYGYPQAPKEDFKVSLCDADGKVLKQFPFPYARFERGEPKWVTLKTPPTPVPAKFTVCIAFSPTQTKGVYVHYDAEGTGHSKQGLPDELKPFDAGDWMIRAEVQRDKGGGGGPNPRP